MLLNIAYRRMAVWGGTGLAGGRVQTTIQSGACLVRVILDRIGLFA